MKFSITKKGIELLIKIGFFLSAAVLVLQLFPKQSAFKYQFQLGRPWAYELVTAPFDFPIYKDEAKVRREESAALKDYAPYYGLNQSEFLNQIAKIDSISADNSLGAYELKKYRNYIKIQLKSIYEKGVFSPEDFETLHKNNFAYVFLIDSNNVASKQLVAEVYTPKTAYEQIIQNKPADLNMEVLGSFSINNLLSPNTRYAEALSNNARSQLLKSVSITSGMIQGGEKIIDTGEKITPNTFAILNSMRIVIDNDKNSLGQFSIMRAGEILLIISLMVLLFLYLVLFRPNIYNNNKHIFFLLLLMVIMVSLSALILNYNGLSVYLVPFAMLPIIIRTFFDSRTALYVHIITVLQISFMMPDSFEFALLQLTAGMTAVASLKDLTQRSQLIRSAILIFVNYAVMYTGIKLMIVGDLTKIVYQNFFAFGLSSLLLLFSYGLIYIFEKFFGFLSNVTLVELSNVNSTLMQEFSEKAPGTFQHSLQVASLATEVAKEINANSLLVRVGALYHDIGKMKNPMFFTENQLAGVNPLAFLEYPEAAKQIINHVNDGVIIARKYNLPEVLIDFITTHHGDGKTRYFYNSFKNEFPNIEIDDKEFEYPGPCPSTKEQALLMITDAIEASSRSLKTYTDESINNLVESIINKMIADGLLRNAHITFHDVYVTKLVLKNRLKTMYHSRISYPELNKQPQ